MHNSSYVVSEIEFNEIDKNKIGETDLGDSDRNQEKVYSYDEAIDLAGTGWYSYLLLLTTIFGYLAMGMEMFGFSVTVTGLSCDFQLDHNQQGILLTIPFISPILMAYFWGYMSDTRGRRQCFLVAMWGGFIFAMISSLSPNWVVLAVFKFISTGLCCCSQSVTFVLLGESVTNKNRGPYILILSSIQMCTVPIYYGLGYLILNQEFSYNLGFITFTPWRLVNIVMGLPLGVTGFLLLLCYESPKYLINTGKEMEALKVLKSICAKNGKDAKKYPVNKVDLNEDGNIGINKGVPLWQSLMDQTIPLFKPPYLVQTIKLFYLVAIVFGCMNSLVMWFPTLAKNFFDGVKVLADSADEGVCNILDLSGSDQITTVKVPCSPKLDHHTLIAFIVEGTILPILNLCWVKLASRKKILLFIILSASAVSVVISLNMKNNIIGFVFLIGSLISKTAIGFIYAYFVEIYPTSYRGMVSCLGMMISRLSALAATNLFGVYLMSNCTTTFYVWSAFMFSGVVATLCLPPDRTKDKEVTQTRKK